MMYADFGSVELISHMGDDLSIVRAARVSYGREPGEKFDPVKDAKLLKYLLRHNHWSPFEHATLTFRVELPIFVARQWMRHRSWSFNEVSARYTQLPPMFFMPDEWRVQSTVNRQGSEGRLTDVASDEADMIALGAFEAVAAAYQSLLALGVGREQARSVLPVGVFTQLYATASLRSVLHFLALRDEPHAQAEIRDYAREVRSLTADVFPHTMYAWDSLQ